MIAYVRSFQIKRRRKINTLDFDYYTGFYWKHLSVIDPIEKPDVATYSRFMLDCVIKDICGKETDVFARDQLLKTYDGYLNLVVQFNPAELSGSVKLFM